MRLLNHKVSPLVVFLRKPQPGLHYSVENNWAAIQPLIREELPLRVLRCPLESRRLFRRLVNGCYVWLQRGRIRHITGDVNYLGLFLPRKGTIQTILDCGGVQQRSWLKKKLIELLWIRIPLRRSEVVIAISETVKAELETYRGSRRCTIRVIPMALHPEFREANREYRWQSPRVLLVGTTPNKNLARSLAALTRLTIQPDVTLCGQDSDHVRGLVENAEISLRRHTRLTISEMSEVYRRNDILLYASTYEGFGMPIIEAQASGTVVVTSNLEPMSSLAGLRAALLVDPNSEASIHEALEQICANSSLRHELIQNGLRNSAYYAPEAVANSYLKVYRDVSSCLP